MNQGVIQNFKTFYRKEIIKRLVQNIDNNESFTINILEAIRTVDEVWRSVTPQTILNCFVKVGFKEDRDKYVPIEDSNSPDDKWNFKVDHFDLDDLHAK